MSHRRQGVATPCLAGAWGRINTTAYSFCALDKLRSAIRRRDMFISPRWRYASLGSLQRQLIARRTRLVPNLPHGAVGVAK